VGVCITDAAGKTVAEIARGIGIATNNVAEYTAAIDGLRRAAELGAAEVLLRSDSRLMVEQLSGRFKVKNPTLQRLHTEVRKLAGSFARIRYEHVPRERNREADRLANLGVDDWLAEGATWSPPGPAPSLWESDPGAGPG
jgi:ribonuclease H / adenosylcobalamin/alpha-ribazole phosphatase